MVNETKKVVLWQFSKSALKISIHNSFLYLVPNVKIENEKYLRPFSCQCFLLTFQRIFKSLRKFVSKF